MSPFRRWEGGSRTKEGEISEGLVAETAGGYGHWSGGEVRHMPAVTVTGE